MRLCAGRCGAPRSRGIIAGRHGGRPVGLAELAGEKCFFAEREANHEDGDQHHREERAGTGMRNAIAATMHQRPM